MAQDPIVIKGTRHGLEIVLDPDYTFAELKSGLTHRLKSANGFFDGAKFSFRQEGLAALTEENVAALLAVCRQYGLVPHPPQAETAPAGTPPVETAAGSRRESETRQAAERRDGDAVVALPVTPAAPAERTEKAAGLQPNDMTRSAAAPTVLTNNTTPVAARRVTPAARVKRTPEITRQAVPAAGEAGPGEEAVLVRRSLRSGQRITARGHVVVMGDVNYGAEVIASGSVFVLGHCRGIIHAGSEGDAQARVLAWKLEPTVLSIAGQRQGANISRILPENCQVALLKGKEFIFQPYFK